MIRKCSLVALALLAMVLVPATAWTDALYGTPKALSQALFFAVSQKDINNLAALRDKGADINSTLKDSGLTASKVFAGHLVYDRLATSTADMDYFPLLSWAVLMEDEDAVRILLKSGVCVNCTDRDGVTPLHWAAWIGNFPITKALMENGADPCMVDTRFRSPLDFAALTSQADVIRLLPKCPPPPLPKDTDGDGVPDDLDQCPDTPLGAPVDERGCWVAAFAQYFSFNSAVVRKKYVPMIQKTADVLKASPNLVVQLEGHTDNVGSENYNMKLGLRRAQAVKKVLVGFGISPDRLKVKSFGEGRPAATNDTKEGRAKNRRVEVSVLAPLAQGCVQ